MAVAKTLLVLAFTILCSPPSRSQQDPAPFDLAYDRGRVLIHLSPRASELLSLRSEYVQIFYYNRASDRILPQGYPTGVVAGYYSDDGAGHVVELFDDGLHLDRERGDGIFANYVAGPLESLTLRRDLDEFFIVTEIDSLGVRVQFLTLPFQPAPLPKILMPFDGPIYERQAEATLIADPSVRSGGLFVTPYEDRMNVLTAVPLWSQPLGSNATGKAVTVPFSAPLVAGRGYYVGLWTSFAPSNSSPTHSLDLVSVLADSVIRIPSSFELSQNFPNPFNRTTIISWNQQESGPITLEIIDVAGRHVSDLLPPNATFSPGTHFSTWDGRDDAGKAVSSGAYFLFARSAHSQKVVKVTLLR